MLTGSALEQAAAVPPASFNKSTNAFSRVNPAMVASAHVDLVGFAGDSIGFYQLLTGDERIGLYVSEQDGSELLLDYGRCNTVLPCRDVLDATSLYSVDTKSLFLGNTGSKSGTVGIPPAGDCISNKVPQSSHRTLQVIPLLLENGF